MKKILITSVLLAMVVGLGTAFARPEGTPDANRIFKFNIIGVSNPKNVNMDQAAGSVVFVNLNGPSKINLVCSDDEAVQDQYGIDAGSFDVLDKNGTDSSGAIVALPDPGLDPYVIGDKGDADTWSNYSIYIRSLGKPGGWATITTCADLLDSTFGGLLPGDLVRVLNREGLFGGYASVEQVGRDITERPKGKSTFTNVTAQLLTIVFKVEVEVVIGTDPDTGEPITEIQTYYIRVPIFDDMLENEYWEYDNNGLKLLQVWIYDNSTDVSEDDGNWNNDPEPDE
jgi:hypothetical protein